MPRLVLLFALLACLGLPACGDEPTAPVENPDERVDYGADSQRLAMDGAAASVQPPAGAWMVRTDRPGPDRWTQQLRRESDEILLQAAVFPAPARQHPMTALVRSIDAFVRSLGTDGFGQTERGAGLVRGASAAWSGFAAVIDGARREGRARIVQVSPTQWALAIGMAPDAAGPEGLALVQAFADSLLPDEVTFYARRFVDPAKLAEAIDGGEPSPDEAKRETTAVTRRDIAAVQLVIEVASGGRFPLAVQPTLRRALAQEAAQGSDASRASFKQVATTLDQTKDMAPAERAAGMRSLGKRILEAIFGRAMEGYGPANQYRLAWQGMGRPAIAHETQSLAVAAMHSLAEMSAFLASLATDQEVRSTEDRAKELRDALEAAWAGLDEETRALYARAGDDWAALRYAWDHADPGAKRAFRRDVAVLLSAPEARAEVEGLADDQALLAWMQANAPKGATFARRAALLAPKTRRELVATLGVEIPAVALGW